jgi:P pilus assembly chaperone PapD
MSLSNRLLFVCYLLLACTSANAGILLDKSIVEFSAHEAPRQDIWVINDDSENAYVKVQVLEVKNPGTEEETREEITDPDLISFVATPSKLVIPPKGRKLVRLVNLAKPGAERVYRINFTPILPPLQEEEGATVRVVIAYQVLALIYPQAPSEQLEIERKGTELGFRNKGNSFVLLGGGTQCDDNNANCQDLPARRLYAGNQWRVTLPYPGTEANYSLSNFKGTRKESIQ